MGFNSSGAVQGGMQGASAGASVGGGWGALVGGVLGAAGGSQMPTANSLPPPPYLTGYGTPSGVSSALGGSYVDPYTGRVVYTDPGGDSSSMLQNMQYDSMLNQLLGIGGGDPMADLDARIKEYQDKLANLGDYKGVVADKYFGKDLGSALIDEKGNLKDFSTLVNAGMQGAGGKRIYYKPDGTVWEGDHTPSAMEMMQLGLKVGNLPENQLNMDNPLVKAFMAQYQGKYGKGGDIADNWYRFVKDVKNNFLDKQNQEYEQARRADEGNQAVRKEQAQAIQRQLDSLTRAKSQYGQAGQGGSSSNSLLGYLTNAPNIQRMEIQKNLSDANSMANQSASRMGMSFSSQNELAKGGNAINSAVAMNNASRQNHQDTMSMMDWLRGGQAQAANQKVQNAQAQLGFTGQGYGLNTHQLDMEAQRQAAAAGLNTSYAFGQANLDSARQQAMMQGLGGSGQGLGSYYGSQSQAKQNPQQLGGTQESANNFGYK